MKFWSFGVYFYVIEMKLFDIFMAAKWEKHFLKGTPKNTQGDVHFCGSEVGTILRLRERGPESDYLEGAGRLFPPVSPV